MDGVTRGLRNAYRRPEGSKVKVSGFEERPKKEKKKKKKRDYWRS